MSDEKQTSRTMLYKHREGPSNPEAWNLSIDTKVVEDDELEAHQADGWKTAAEIHEQFHGDAEAKPRARRAAEPKPAE